MARFEFVRADSGNYRLYYRKRSNRALYCIQNEGGWGKDRFVFNLCSHDGEPECEAKWPDELRDLSLDGISLERRP